jgi:hypothetical protein
MIYKLGLVQKLMQFTLFCFVVLFFSFYSAYSQQIAKKAVDSSVYEQKLIINVQKDTLISMAFFIHRGISLNKGTLSLKAAVLPTQIDDKTNMQYNFQLETDITKRVGFYLGGKALFFDPMKQEAMQFPEIEAIVQFFVFQSENGMSGFSPLIGFEFPWWKNRSRDICPLYGFSTTLSNSHIAFNQDIQYSTIEYLGKGSVSMVIKISKRTFLVSEVSGVIQKGIRPIFNLLTGIKIEVHKDFTLGIAYQLPLTSNRDYSSQFVFQPNLICQNWSTK